MGSAGFARVEFGRRISGSRRRRGAARRVVDDLRVVGGRHRARLRGSGDRLAGAGGDDVGAEVGGALVTIVAPLRERVQHDRVERRRHRRLVERRGLRLFADVLIDEADGLADERCAPRQQLEQDAAGGVQVGASVDALALRLLGRQVPGGADDGLGARHRRADVGEGAGDAEVHDLDGTAARHHDVARLDVAVHDALRVAVLEG